MMVAVQVSCNFGVVGEGLSVACTYSAILTGSFPKSLPLLMMTMTVMTMMTENPHLQGILLVCKSLRSAL